MHQDQADTPSRFDGPEGQASANDPRALLAQARSLRANKQLPASIALAEDALAAAQEADLIREIRFELGSSLLAAGHWDAARQQLQACLDAGGPAQPGPLYHRLGRAHQELGDPAQAERCYTLALAAKHGKAAAKTWHQLGRVREQSGKVSDAAEAYAHAITGFEAAGQTREAGIAAYQLGKLQQAAANWAEAGAAFSRARAWLASDAALRAEACYALGELAIRGEDYETASDALHEAIGIQRHLRQQAGLGMSLLKLCQVLMLQRQWKAVLRTVREAITALEGCRETKALRLAYELQGELLQLLGQEDDAQEWFARAKSLA